MSQRAWTHRPAITEPVVIEDGVRDAWDFGAALESATPGNLFPSRVGWTAAQKNDDAWRALDGQAASGFRAYPAEIVAVPKSDRTSRPAADLPTEDQLVYAAIVNALRGRIAGGLVTFTDDEFQTYEEFERFPLEQPSARYVIEGDAAAFFQYIDYERLAYELIGLTGWSDAVEPLIRLLEIWMGGAKGIPQGPQPSRALADIYISPVARILQREGWLFSRYSDDFRIIARSWQHARSGHYALEAALAERGLVPAANKARTYKIDNYRRRLEKVDAPRLAGAASREVFEELDAEYAPASQRILVTEEDVVRAERVLDEQLAVVSSDTIGPRLIRRSLSVLGSGGSPHALGHLRTLMRRYPHLTQATAGYLRLLMGTEVERRAVNATVTWLKSSELQLPWQVGWVLNATLYATERHDRLAEYAASRFGDASLPWFVQGQISLVLALHGRLPSLSEYVSLYELSPAATRPDLIAAVNLGHPTWGSRFLTGAADSSLLAAVSRLDIDQQQDWL